jgi:hypothetical protein
MNADNPDNFSFVLLTDVTVGTEITFTDSGRRAAGITRDARCSCHPNVMCRR